MRLKLVTWDQYVAWVMGLDQDLTQAQIDECERNLSQDMEDLAPTQCVVTKAVSSLNGARPGEEVILSRGAALEHARRGRVLVIGPLEPTTDASEEE